MHLTYKKGFDGDLNKLPQREVPGAVQFKEFESMEKLSLVANLLAIGLAILFFAPVLLKIFHFLSGDGLRVELWQLILLVVLEIVTIPVHEVLHASAFKEEVEFYTYLRKGLAFVTGTESMTKGRFIFMSLLPNLVLGVIPYLLFFLFPSQLWLGIWAAGNIAAGAGDYINVFNAATQMPKGSLCYMSGMHTYWYMPGEEENV
ncbi:MAG: DUF3267 domain-containing protein [Lachnospiraceae bacterium]|nr:DUF3267 domain-containing protein [Lachnospiraceae bacterium]